MKLFGKLDNLYSVTSVQVFESVLLKYCSVYCLLKLIPQKAGRIDAPGFFSLYLSFFVQPKVFYITFCQNQKAVEYCLIAAGNYLNLNCL